MTNRTLVSVLIASMIGASIVGCGGKTDAGSAEAAAPAAEAEAAVEEEAAPAEETAEVQEEAPAEEAAEAQEEAPAEEAAEAQESAQIANPWSEVDSAEAAAEGAGLEFFTLQEDLILEIGEEFERTYRCMDGIAEARLEFPAVMVTVRKGTAAEDGDISGDYNTYANTWTENFKGLEVTCFGNREGEATKTIWTLGDMSFSISAMGLGGDSDFGLRYDDLKSIIMGLQ